MAIQNADIRIADLPIHVIDSFVGHTLEKKVFPKGTRLNRVVSLGNNSFMGSFCVTEWYFAEIKKYSTLRKIPIRQAIRECLALSPKFSPSIDVEVAIILGESMYGFVGQAASQVDAGKHFPGGCQQVFMPNLTRVHSNRLKLVGRLP